MLLALQEGELACEGSALDVARALEGLGLAEQARRDPRVRFILTSAGRAAAALLRKLPGATIEVPDPAEPAPPPRPEPRARRIVRSLPPRGERRIVR